MLVILYHNNTVIRSLNICSSLLRSFPEELKPAKSKATFFSLPESRVLDSPYHSKNGMVWVAVIGINELSDYAGQNAIPLGTRSVMFF